MAGSGCGGCRWRSKGAWRCVRGSAALLFVGLLVLLPGPAAFGQKAGHEQVVLFKDGFIVRGKIKQDMTRIYDVSGQSFVIPALNGFYFVEDGARGMIFSPGQVHGIVELKLNARQDQEKFSQDFGRVPNSLPNNWQVSKIGPWNINNSKVERRLDITLLAPNGTPAGERQLTQRMTLITPEFVRVKTYEVEWHQYFLTSEIPPDKLRSIILSHPRVKKLEDTYQRQKIVYRFLIQAGFTDAAERD